MNTESDHEHRDLRATTGSPPVPGRLPVLAGMSLLASAIPLPFLPDRAVLQVRGAIVHDVLSRHGISTSSEARAALAEPHSGDRVRALLRKGAEMLTRRLLRRIGPLAPLAAVVSALEVYALGHLLERYVDRVRPLRLASSQAAGGVRMHEPEARRVREAIDRALLRSVYPSVQASPLLLTEGVEDLRDEFTRWIDALLLTGATLPSWLQRRLDAAFDEVVAETPDLTRS